ncbi:MAG: LemA family protein [Actinobacteria bacterium]|nr:LemA family protein [Actinomycetota bacterium]
MSTTVLILIIGAVFLIVLVWLVLTYNGLVRLRNEAQQGESSIDIQLKRRADLIPNLVEAVKGYAAHEQEAFERVTAARAHALEARSLGDKAAADGETRSALGGLLAVAEAYPQLRAVESFTQLQAELSDTEDKIAAARRYYNNVVQRYNTKQQSFPASAIAGTFGFLPREFYRIEDDAQRDPVKVEIGG